MVREPTSGLCITYRQTANEPLLVAINSVRRIRVEELREGLEVAYAKHTTLGWL